MRQFRKLQYEDELIGYMNLSEEELNRKGFVPQSYCEQRKKIIQAHFPSLSDGLVQELAKNTRGKRKDDIVKSVENFLSSGQPIKPYKDPYWVVIPKREAGQNEYYRWMLIKNYLKKMALTFLCIMVFITCIPKPEQKH